ncbi:MAG: hypothetical protein M0Z53_07160 [Thermaerobacter sp.]|nr:hypothetical protein [Thermaerobacter sp.]
MCEANESLREVDRVLSHTAEYLGLVGRQLSEWEMVIAAAGVESSAAGRVASAIKALDQARQEIFAASRDMVGETITIVDMTPAPGETADKSGAHPQSPHHHHPHHHAHSPLA